MLHSRLLVRKKSLAKVARLTKEQIRSVQDKVRSRDNNRCLIDGSRPAEVHEFLHRSSGRTGSSEIFSEEYMGCLCSKHHSIVHRGDKCDSDEIIKKALTILTSRYGYKY